jgi:rfaE bifunctional protein kinase chain/domain
MEDFRKLFNAFSTLKVGVIGDLMLDTYMWGGVERISPEAPVPVVTLQKKEYRVGGAGNVALNCKSLGARVSVLSVIGDDAEGMMLSDLIESQQVDATYLVVSRERVTTSKTRIISRNQQMMRLDSESTADLGHADEEALMARISDFVAKEDPDIIIFEDYNKGVLTERLIHRTIEKCREAGVLTAVDPKRKNFFSYRHADIFKPNLKEVKEGLNIIVDEIDPKRLSHIHEELKKILHHSLSLVTLSDKGIFYSDSTHQGQIPSHLRNIADVSGAGDTVIAVASLVYTATRNPHLMAEVANIAGGLVCEEVGTVAISREKLLNECELLLS